MTLSRYSDPNFWQLVLHIIDFYLTGKFNKRIIPELFANPDSFEISATTKLDGSQCFFVFNTDNILTGVYTHSGSPIAETKDGELKIKLSSYNGGNVTQMFLDNPSIFMPLVERLREKHPEGNICIYCEYIPTNAGQAVVRSRKTSIYEAKNPHLINTLQVFEVYVRIEDDPEDDPGDISIISYRPTGHSESQALFEDILTPEIVLEGTMSVDFIAQLCKFIIDHKFDHEGLVLYIKGDELANGFKLRSGLAETGMVHTKFFNGEFDYSKAPKEWITIIDILKDMILQTLPEEKHKFLSKPTRAGPAKKGDQKEETTNVLRKVLTHGFGARGAIMPLKMSEEWTEEQIQLWQTDVQSFKKDLREAFCTQVKKDSIGILMQGGEVKKQVMKVLDAKSKNFPQLLVDYL
jgi:hypothetical protein